MLSKTDLHLQDHLHPLFMDLTALSRTTFSLFLWTRTSLYSIPHLAPQAHLVLLAHLVLHARLVLQAHLVLQAPRGHLIFLATSAGPRFTPQTLTSLQAPHAHS